MDENIQTFWHQFCKKHNLNENTPVEAWAFGANQKDANELASLDEKLPKVGEWGIILDGNAKPVCVIKDVCVEIIPYNLISQEHAYHEGEGDCSYTYWRTVHDEFFTRKYKERGKIFYSQAPMVCEVFEKIK